MARRRIAPTSTFIKRYMSANNVSQRDICEAGDYSEKQVSVILNDKAPVTEKFANVLAKCIPGLKASFVLNYYHRYKEQLEEDRKFLEDNNYEEMSKKYSFKKIFKGITDDIVEMVEMILDSYHIDNLSKLTETLNEEYCTIGTSFSRDQSKQYDKESDLLKIWVNIVANNMYEEEEKAFVGREQLEKYLENNKFLLNVTDSDTLIFNIEYICRKCGIHIAFTHAVPSTYIRGLTFSKNGEVYIVLTDRFKKIEYVIFAFVHELEHIINGDVNLNGECIRFDEKNIEEKEDTVNNRARDYLIDSKYLPPINDMFILTRPELFEIARKANSTAGLVASRIQHDTKKYTLFWDLLNNFELTNGLFDI